MRKKLLSEIAIYSGDVKMPEYFEIDRETIFNSLIKYNTREDITTFPHSKELDKLNTYLSDFINLNYDIKLITKNTTGDIYPPRDMSEPKLEVNPVDLYNSPDFVMLYGVNVGEDSCEVVIEYDDNRRKGRTWSIPLKNNYFIMFPATQKYHISKNKSDQINFILTTTYEYI